MLHFREYLGYFLALVGIILSIYFYEISRKEREPVFIIEPIRTEIINSKLLVSGIRVIRNDSQEIKGNLTSLRFYFYNKGREVIKNENILSKIIIRTDPDTKIIYSRILKVSRKINEIGLSQIDSNLLNVTFNILELNDGFTGELLVEGNSNTKVIIEGDIEGVKQFSKFPAALYKMVKSTVIYFIFGVLGIFYFIYLEKIYKKKATKIKNENIGEQFKKSELDDMKWSKISNRIILALIIIFLFLNVVGGWFSAKRQINENPSNYIPASIRP